MNLLVINPINSDRFDQEDLNYFSRFSNRETILKVKSLDAGPEAIETYSDEAEAAPFLLKMVRETDESYNGIMINCFADPALQALKEEACCPVFGPGRTSILIATMLGQSFSIISTGRAKENRFLEKIEFLGIGSRLRSIEQIPISVPELDQEPERTKKELCKALKKARSAWAEVVILGCTGLRDYYPYLKKRTELTLIEPAVTTLKLMESLISLNLNFFDRRVLDEEPE